MDSGYVYLVRCDPGYIKIGHSADPVQRLKVLRQRSRSTAPADADVLSMKLIGMFPGGLQEEKALHRELFIHRASFGNEWFFEDKIAQKITDLNLTPPYVIPPYVIRASPKVAASPKSGKAPKAPKVDGELSEIRRKASKARKTFGGGRPRSDSPRCPCGVMTAKRASARRHKCAS